MTASPTERGRRAEFVLPLLFAVLCGIVLFAHSDIGFDPVRVKLVTRPTPSGNVPLTAIVPPKSEVPPVWTPSVLIARLGNRGDTPLTLQVLRNDAEVAAAALGPGETRRFDLEVPSGTAWHPGDRVTVRGDGQWTLEYLELANVHGSSRKFFQFQIVPVGERPGGRHPTALILVIVVFAAVIGLWREPSWPGRWWRHTWLVTSGVALIFVVLVALSDVVTRFTLLVPLETVVVCVGLFCWKGLGQAFLDTSAWLERRSEGSAAEAAVDRSSRLLDLLDLRVIAVVIVLLALVSVKTGFSGPGLPAGHDVLTHATYAYFFDRALAQGQFPVRWTELVFEGHSQPAFNFYYVGLYHIVEGVHVFVRSLSQSLTLTIVLLWWTGAGFMFLLFRRLGTMPAVLAALVFALSPYLILDVFVRSAYAEFSAIAIAPGLLWVVDRFLRTGRPGCWLAAAFLTCAMLACHLGTVLIFSPVFAAYVAYLLLTRQTTFVTVLQAAGAALLGFNMAAFYVLPAVFEMDLINIRLLVTGYGEYQRHFVQPSQWVDFSWGFGNSREGMQDQMSFQIGIVQWAFIATGAVMAIVSLARRRELARTRDLLFWLGVTGFAMFIMTAASEPLWRVVPSLAFVQFPWRFSMLISVGCAALAALLLSSVRHRQVQAAVVILVAVLLVELHGEHLKPRGFFSAEELNIDDPNWRNTARARALSFVEHGYYPAGVIPTRLSNTLPGRWTISRGRASVKAVSVKDHALVLDAESAGEFQITINTPYFPGWRVWVDGREARTFARPATAYMDVRVPPGRHRIEARFTNTPLRQFANMASVGSTGVFLFLLVWSAYAWARRPVPGAAGAESRSEREAVPFAGP